MKIAPYQPIDTEEITRLFTKVFSDSEGQSEGVLIGNLVNDMMTGTDSQDLYGFVALEDERIIGGIFFTKLTFPCEERAFLLSPVAIHTNFQRKGIGQKLIHFGLKRIKEKGVKSVMTYGDPEFYSKVGFDPMSEKTVKAPYKLSYPEGWLGQSLCGNTMKLIAGESHCVVALSKPEYW